DPDVTMRTLAAHAALAEVLAIGLLARGEKRARLQYITLCVGVLGAIAWGWAWISPGSPTAALDRFVVLLVALVATSVLYGLGPAKFFRSRAEWAQAARRLVPALLVMGAVVLASLLGIEVVARASGRDVAISVPAVVAVAVALAGAGVAALVAALVPGRDPLGLSERGRTAYVYACEALLALIVLHGRITLPW